MVRLIHRPLFGLGPDLKKTFTAGLAKSQAKAYVLRSTDTTMSAAGFARCAGKDARLRSLDSGSYAESISYFLSTGGEDISCGKLFRATWREREETFLSVSVVFSTRVPFNR